MTLQTPFYLLFMLNNGVLDATIKGRGKTKYMMYQSLFIDVGYYSMVFALYSAGILAISLTTISLVFGMGMALDLIPTLYFYRKSAGQMKNRPMPSSSHMMSTSLVCPALSS